MVSWPHCFWACGKAINTSRWGVRRGIEALNSCPQEAKREKGKGRCPTISLKDTSPLSFFLNNYSNGFLWSPRSSREEESPVKT
jgi:hypothetical protein